MIGLAIIFGGMAVAVSCLWVGATKQKFNYWGREITRAKQPLYFWYAMVVCVIVIGIGIWILPRWFEVL